MRGCDQIFPDDLSHNVWNRALPSKQNELQRMSNKFVLPSPYILYWFSLTFFASKKIREKAIYNLGGGEHEDIGHPLSIPHKSRTDQSIIYPTKIWDRLYKNILDLNIESPGVSVRYLSFPKHPTFLKTAVLPCKRVGKEFLSYTLTDLDFKSLLEQILSNNTGDWQGFDVQTKLFVEKKGDIYYLFTPPPNVFRFPTFLKEKINTNLGVNE